MTPQLRSKLHRASTTRAINRCRSDRVGRLEHPTSTRSPLDLLLVLHSPILEPDLDLALSQVEFSRQVTSNTACDISIGNEDAFQFGQLLFRVRTAFLSRRPRGVADRK